MQIVAIQTQIIGNQETNSVNARELHQALGIKKDFSDWIKAQIKSLHLEENFDYIIVFPQKGEQKKQRGGHNAKDYIITLDAAKHIAMVSRTQKGKEVRAYFIEIEKAYKNAHKNNPILNRLDAIENKIENIAQNQEIMGQILAKTVQQVENTALALKSVTELTVKPLLEKVYKTSTKKEEKCNISILKHDKLRLTFKNLIEVNPGMSQGELLVAVGEAKDSKTARKALLSGVGIYYYYKVDGRQKLYYPISQQC